jgi:hypothetical protein
VVIVHGQGQLPYAIDALDAAGGFAGRLHRGQQQPNQNANDGDYYEQLNQRKSMTAMRHDKLLLGKRHFMLRIGKTVRLQSDG